MRTYRVCFIDVPSIEGLRFGRRRPRLGPMKGTCFYVADPMCSWCWAFAPIIDEVAGALPAEVELRYVLGGLAPDSDVPMPEEMQKKLQATWRTIAARTGTEFNFDFWKACKPRRSTYPACRAVLAAKTQETAKTSAMFRAIQRAYYQEARNPSDTETLTELASEIDLDVDRFVTDLVSPHIEEELKKCFNERRRLNAYAFPSLIIEFDGTSNWITEGYAPASDVLPRVAARLG